MKNPPLHYERFGRRGKHPIVLLHGFLGSITDWSLISHHLQNDFDILAIDLPGHGDNHNIGLNYSFDDTADAIIQILDDEKMPSCSLLGYSMGGRMALYTALHYPDRFSQLILESSTPGFQHTKERKARLDFEKKIIDKLGILSMPDFIRDWYGMPLFDSIRKHPNVEKLVSSRLCNKAASLIAVLQNLGSGVMPNLWDDMRRLDLPIHFIYGDKDAKYKMIADGIQRAGKNVSLYEIKNSGHNTHFENPQEFCIVLKNILKE